MSISQNVNDGLVGPSEASGGKASVWQLVLKSELTELWLGGRVLNLLILFSILISITAYLLATNNELSLTPRN